MVRLCPCLISSLTFLNKLRVALMGINLPCMILLTSRLVSPASLVKLLLMFASERPKVLAALTFTNN